MSVAGTGCAAETSDQAVEADARLGSVDTAIYGGSKDDDGDSAPGVVALRVGTGTTFELCSGTLIAPNVVLTARHCVTQNASTSVSCDENGNSANGRHVVGNEDPSTIGVYLGAAPHFAKPAASMARAIVAPSGPYLCDADIALVVLATPITEIAPLAVRMHTPARPGEMIRSIGYGQNDQASPIGTRFRKDDVQVLAQGKTISPSKTPLGAHEFEVGKSICQGDSGGPAISEATGAVLGVVSRGGGCDDDFGHIYTTTAGFETLFDDAFVIAGGAPTIEDADAPSTSTRSNTEPLGDLGAAPRSDNQGGCSVSPRSGIAGSDVGGFGVFAALALLGARRRRR